MTMPREKILVLQSPEELTILFEMPRMVRRVRMNATHPSNLEPSYVGDSVGRWEGNTLVVDTAGLQWLCGTRCARAADQSRACIPWSG